MLLCAPVPLAASLQALGAPGRAQRRAAPFLVPAIQCSEHPHRASYRNDRGPAKKAAKKPRTADETDSDSDSENEDAGSAQLDADREASPHPPSAIMLLRPSPFMRSSCVLSGAHSREPRRT